MEGQQVKVEDNYDGCQCIYSPGSCSPLDSFLSMLLVFLLCLILGLAHTYDPSDTKLAEVLPPAGDFDPFYSPGDAIGAARAPHDHGSFYGHRNAALVQVRNAPAYGFRFGGTSRRFNYD